jgi:hypothetical protein
MKVNEKISIRLLSIVKEIQHQTHVEVEFLESELSFKDNIKFLYNFIENNEIGVAYQSLVSMLECHSFAMSSIASVQLLEIGLLFGYKTDHPKDEEYKVK